MKKIPKAKDIEKEFSEIIREKMTDKQFNEWFMSWFDVQEACDMAEEWEIDVKLDELPRLRKIIKNNK